MNPGISTRPSSSWPVTRRLGGLLILLCALSAWLSAGPANAAFELTPDVQFLDDVGDAVTQAGSHPDSYETSFELVHLTTDQTGAVIPEEELKDIYVDLPPGLVGNPSVVSTCTTEEFLDRGTGFESRCPDDTVVGIARNTLIGNPPQLTLDRLYNLAPTPGAAARFGFKAGSFIPVTFTVVVSPDPPYHLVARVENVPQINPLLSSGVTMWGTPADPKHDAERAGPSSLPERAFLTMPRSCPGTPLTHAFSAASWLNPGTFVDYDVATPAMTGCGALGFAPVVAAQPSEKDADSPSGFDFDIDVDDAGLDDPDANAESDLKKAVVTLPEGLTANPASADGLTGCTPAQVAQETAASDFGDGCPAASKLGTVDIDTPLLPNDEVTGSIFLATQDDPDTVAPGAENPFDSMLAGYIVAKSKDRGVGLVLPGKITPNLDTGRLVAEFDNNPQFPFEHLNVHFKSGSRAPLATPQTCGTYDVTSELTPWSGGASTTQTDSFTVDHAPGGGACVAGDPSEPGDPGDVGALPFNPVLSGGLESSAAGVSSPFHVKVTRPDGDQTIKALHLDLPPGVTAKLAGVTKCSDAAIASIDTSVGRGSDEVADPSCPANSQVGTVKVGAGVGDSPFYVNTGKVYLAGPYEGAPLSLAVVTPAVAGPFDLGTVVIRSKLNVDADDAQVHVDSGSIPHILEGIPLRIRDIRVAMDRPGFMQAPTSCQPMQITGSVTGGGADLVSDSDDTTAPISQPFGVGDCGALGFAPKMTGAILNGADGIHRSDHPELSFDLAANPGDANISAVSVALPESIQIDQSNLGNICSESQLVATECAGRTQIGTAVARTPLLDDTLGGPVYAVSGSGGLPRLAVILKGEVDLLLRSDTTTSRTATGASIVSTFPLVPDAAVSSFNLTIRGGANGYLVNNRDVCGRTKVTRKKGRKGKKNRRFVATPVTAQASYTAQNGDTLRQTIPIAASCPKPKKAKKRKKRRK